VVSLQSQTHVAHMHNCSHYCVMYLCLHVNYRRMRQMRAELYKSHKSFVPNSTSDCADCSTTAQHAVLSQFADKQLEHFCHPASSIQHKQQHACLTAGACTAAVRGKGAVCYNTTDCNQHRHSTISTQGHKHHMQRVNPVSLCWVQCAQANSKPASFRVLAGLQSWSTPDPGLT
jgi:hypothetical protein